MNIEIVRETDDQMNLALTGRLDVQGSEEIGIKFTGLLNNLNKDVTIDLAGVEFLSSMGIRLLLNGQKMTVREGHRYKLIQLRPEVQRVLEMAGLQILFV